MTQSKAYYEGFGAGWHKVPCLADVEADYQAGWLDGVSAQEQGDRPSWVECPECGEEIEVD